MANVTCVDHHEVKEHDQTERPKIFLLSQNTELLGSAKVWTDSGLYSVPNDLWLAQQAISRRLAWLGRESQSISLQWKRC